MVGVAQKLQLKPGQRVQLLNPPDNPESLLGDLPEGARFIGEGEAGDAAIGFAKDAGELRGVLDAGGTVAAGDRLFWVCYPKGGSAVKTDLKRDVVAAMAREVALQAVSQVSVDETWSALRLRPAGRYESKG